MLRLQGVKLKQNVDVQKNVLYQITEDRAISIYELHTEDTDVVTLDYMFENGQYAYLGQEYRNPSVSKVGCKMADIMTFVVDEERKSIHSLVLDMKKDISAFSDDLLKEGAILVALNEVRDFIKQLHDENVQKNMLLYVYRDEEFVEKLEFGIATRSFEAEKFANVADFLEKLDDMEKPESVPELLWVKFKNSFRPYSSEIVKLRDFSNKRVSISGEQYDLRVYILEKEDEGKYAVTIPMKAV